MYRYIYIYSYIKILRVKHGLNQGHILALAVLHVLNSPDSGVAASLRLDELRAGPSRGTRIGHVSLLKRICIRQAVSTESIIYGRTRETLQDGEVNRTCFGPRHQLIRAGG